MPIRFPSLAFSEAFAQTVAGHLERCETAGLGDRLRRSRLLGLANRLAA